MKTLFTLIQLLFQLSVATISFVIFIAVEIYVVDYIDMYLQNIGKGQYSPFLWLFCYLIITIEVITFLFNFVWKKLINRFKLMFKLN